MGGCVIEEQAITRAQYLDKVYFKTKTLYDLLPNSSRPSMGKSSSKPTDTLLIDGVIG